MFKKIRSWFGSTPTPNKPMTAGETALADSIVEAFTPRPEPKKPVVKIVEIPDEEAEKFCELYDAMNADESGKLEVYRMWRFAEKFVPLGYEDWAQRIQFSDSHRPYIELSEADFKD